MAPRQKDRDKSFDRLAWTVGVLLVATGLVSWFGGGTQEPPTKTVTTVVSKHGDDTNTKVTEASSAADEPLWPRNETISLGLVVAGLVLLGLTIPGFSFRLGTPGGGSLELSRAALAAKTSVAFFKEVGAREDGAEPDAGSLELALLEAFEQAGVVDGRSQATAPATPRPVPTDAEIDEIARRVSATLR